MTPKQRMKAMMAGETIDYLPSQLDFVPHRLKLLLDELGMSNDEFDCFSSNHFFHAFPLTESCYYSCGSQEEEALIDMAVERNLYPRHPDPKYIYDNFGVPWLKNPTGIHNADFPLKDKNLDAFPWPDPNVPGLFDHVTEGLASHRDEYYVVGLQHLTFWERTFLTAGYQNMMLAMADDLPFVEALMDRILEFHVGLAHRFVELGVDAVRTGDDFGTQRGMQIAPDLWRQLIKPRLPKIWEVYHEAGVCVMHHSCGYIEPIIPDMIETGLELLHPIQPLSMSVDKLADDFGSQVAFHGGIDTQQLLPFGKPEEVKAAVKHCVETLGSNGRYVIAPSQEIMNDVPTANIKALIEGIHEYRKNIN